MGFIGMDSIIFSYSLTGSTGFIGFFILCFRMKKRYSIAYGEAGYNQHKVATIFWFRN